MSRLILVRHGQASFGKDDYDQLSEKGYEQSRLLGKYLLKKNYLPDLVFMGPLKRHAQTWDMVREEYENVGKSFPEGKILEGLREHQATEVIQTVMPELSKKHPILADWELEILMRPETTQKNRMRILHYFMRVWSKGELGFEHPKDLQDWSSFRQAVSGAIETMIGEKGKSLQVIAFTSGGTIAASMGHALQMTQEHRIAELNARIANTSLTEFLFTYNRMSLHSFNQVSHLEGTELISYV